MRKLRQAERTNLSDQRMVEAAIAIILERGIGALRLTDVGLQAGYSRGLAAMRFGTMGNLLRRVAEKLDERWIKALTEAVGEKRGLAAIFAAIDTQEQVLVPPASNVHVQYLILFNSLDPGASDRLNVARVMVAQRSDLARWIGEAVQAGEIPADTDAEVEAEALLSSLVGMIFQSLLDPSVCPARMCAKLKADIAARFGAAPSIKRSRTTRRLPAPHRYTS